MNEILTPDQIAIELRAVVASAEVGPDKLKHAETRLAACEAAYQDAFDSGFRDATGTIADREIAGRAEASVVRQLRDEARAEVNHVKATIKFLENQQVSLSVQLKAVLVTYQGAGR